MNALLVRVGADRSKGGGRWNGPVDGRTGNFIYAPIPESRPLHSGLEKPFTSLEPSLLRFGVELPVHLLLRNMHLDPDFDHLTYGDRGERGKQIRAKLRRGDLIVFYAGLADTSAPGPLVYAIIGLLTVNDIIPAAEVREEDRMINAHTRRILAPGAEDLIVRGRPGASGRLTRCLPIGEYRDRAYRARKDLIDEWGGLSVKNGYLQRSARLPRFLDPKLFLGWFEKQGVPLVQSNN